MTDKELLETILTKLGGLEDTVGEIKVDLAGVKEDLAGVKEDLAATKKELKAEMAEIKEELAEIKENTEVTRVTVNSLVEWADNVSVITQIHYPVKKAN